MCLKDNGPLSCPACYRNHAYSTAATPTAAPGSGPATDLTASVSLAIRLSHTHIDLTGFAVSRFTVQYFGTIEGKLTLFAICRSAMLFLATAVDGLSEN